MTPPSNDKLNITVDNNLLGICLIPCSDNCIYQTDGYCSLEKPSIITDNTNSECAYYVKK